MSDSSAPPRAARFRKPGFVKLLLVVLPALAVLGIAAGPAYAVPCFPIATANTPLGVTEDNIPLTAALVNPPDTAVPENLDATGCDIGIYYDTPGHNLVDKNVFGARYYGVLSNLSTATDNNISFGSVYDIGNKPHDGSQHGIGVAYRNGAGGRVDHSQIYDYQKGGVLVNGVGTSVQVLDNVVRGLGPVPFIAQNGVQISRGATGNVNGNFIEDNEYTGCSKADAKATGCIYTVSTGILLFQVDPAFVDTKNNAYRNNDVNLFNGSNL
jgi:hypothetical protein